MAQLRLGLTGLFIAALITTGVARAEDTPSPGDLEGGKALFARYCVACHGENGDGDGPMRPVLVIEPADLRQLTARGNGVFPLQRVVWRIDGRDPLLSHGSMMPVYGEVFAAGPPETLRTHAGQPIMTTEPMADLVAYLRALQVK